MLCQNFANPGVGCGADFGGACGLPIIHAAPVGDVGIKEIRLHPRIGFCLAQKMPLARNDLGRVCVPGTVTVPDYAIIERYSHVMHIVSQVEGTLAADKDAFDLFRATFPAGTLSGAPKVRAMQVISELEGERRGVYGGAVGYFGFDGGHDSCIVIRTASLRDGVASIQAGAGVVADSVPTSEYEETINKSKSVLRALGLAAGLRS